MRGIQKTLWGFGFLLLSALTVLLSQASPVQAAAGVNQQLSFQGKVVNSSGTNLSDGTYNMEFKVYQDGNSSGSGSTLKWTEDYLVGGSGGVTVTAGTFNVALGSHTAFGSSVDWNQDTLWLSFQVGNTSSCTISTTFQSNCSGDGEMTPYIRLTAVPQAMNASRVGGLTADQLVQLTPSSQQSGSINISGGITSGGAISATGASLSSLTNCDRLNSNSSGAVGCSTSADLRVSKLSVYGDSYAAGGTVATPDNFNTNRFTSKLAAMLHAQEFNKAVNGTASIGGWNTVLQDETRSNTAAPYTAAPGMYLVNYGLNDIKYLGPSSYGPMQEALRTIISRFRAAAVFEDSAASVSYGGTWASNNSTTRNSGSTYRSTTTNGNTVTINVPSDFPGGTVDIGLIATSNGDGAVHTIKEGSTTLTTVDTHNMQTTNGGNNGYLGVVRRITLSAGAHTLVDTVSSISGTTYFDYWQIEAPTPPVVIMPLAPRIMSYSTFSPYTPVDADITTLNSAKTSVKNEFDGNVISVDFDSVLNKTAAYFTSDNVHPNDQGNSLLAAALYKAITAVSYTVDQQAYGASLQASNYSDNYLFRNNDDSTTGFQIQTSTGTQLFTADTTNQRIGLGTNAPGYQLDVRGTAGSQLHLSGDATDTGAYLIGAATGAWWGGNSAYTGTGASFVAKATTASVITNANGLFKFSSDTGLTVGNTYTPTTRFQVDGTGNATVTGTLTTQGSGASSIAGGLTVSGSGSSIAGLTIAGTSTTTLDTVQSVLSVAIPLGNDYLNGITIKAPSTSWGPRGGDPLAEYGKGQFIEFLKEGTPTVAPDDNVLFRVDSSGGVGTAGGLHIATGLRQDAGYTATQAVWINPQMDTVGEVITAYSSQSLPLFMLQANGGSTLSQFTNSGQLQGIQGSASAPALSFVSDTNTGIFSSAADTLDVSTGGTSRLQINSSGQVGIGTPGAIGYQLDLRNSTSSQLHISGNSSDTGTYLTSTAGGYSAVQNQVAYNGTGFVAKATAASEVAQFVGNLYFRSDTGLTAGATYTPTIRFQVDPSGNGTFNGALAVQGGAITAGTSSQAGSLVLNDGSGHTATITVPTVATYSIALPAAAPSTSQCLQSGAGTATNLTWGACGGVTWPLAYSGTQAFQPSGVSNSAFSIINNASAVNGLTVTGTASGSDPILSSTAGLSLQPANGIVALNRASTNNELRVYENSATPTNYATIKYSGGAAIFGASSGIAQLGSASGPVTIPLTGASDNFAFTKTYTPVATYNLSDFSVTRTLAAGANLANGNVANIQDTSSGSNTSSAPNVLYLNQNNTAFGGNLIQAQTGGSTTRFNVDTLGNVNASNGYKVGGVAGTGAVCSGGQFYQATTVSGGIATAGSCASVALTLQNTYDNSSSPATITTSSSSKTFLLQAGNSFDSATLFQVKSSASGTNIAVLTADTSNLIIQIGSATSDANAVLLVLDSYNNATDPTGTNGGLYYNTTSNKFRCYQNGNWTDCVSFGTVAKPANQAAPASSTTLHNDNDLVVGLDASTTYVFNAYIPVDDSNATADLAYTFTVPTGASITAFATTYSSASLNVICNIIASAQPCTTTINNANNFINVQGFVTTGATAGDLQFQFAQRASTAAAFPVVKAGATLQWHRQ